MNDANPGGNDKSLELRRSNVLKWVIILIALDVYKGGWF